MQKQITKYKPWGVIDLPNREWPNRTIDRAPIWCSVDLRGWQPNTPYTHGREGETRTF